MPCWIATPWEPTQIKLPAVASKRLTPLGAFFRRPNSIPTTGVYLASLAKGLAPR